MRCVTSKEYLLVDSCGMLRGGMLAVVIVDQIGHISGVTHTLCATIYITRVSIKLLLSVVVIDQII